MQTHQSICNCMGISLDSELHCSESVSVTVLCEQSAKATDTVFTAPQLSALVRHATNGCCGCNDGIAVLVSIACFDLPAYVQIQGGQATW